MTSACLCDVERAHTFRPVQLVRRQREQIHAQAIHIERNLACSLHRVGVKQHAVQFGEVSEFLDRLQRSYHVIRRHDRRPESRRLQRAQQALGATRPSASTGKCVTLFPAGVARKRQVSRIAACSMDVVTTWPGLPLARTAPMSARLSASVPLAVKMISSGSAPISAATCARAVSTAVAGHAAFVMQARRISKRSAKKWTHRREHPGIKRRGGGMIKINSRIHDASPVWLRGLSGSLGPARLKTRMPHPGCGDEAIAHRDLMSPANRAGIGTR